MNFTDEQLAAIESSHPQFVIRASAGSGKTRVLVSRYLRYVTEENVPADRILTITFTKRAAVEMKSRIVKELRDMGLVEAAQRAETGPIQTIHSFCERILRENSIAAGIDPDFEIHDTMEGVTRFRQSFREAMTDSLSEGGISSRLIGETAALTERDSREGADILRKSCEALIDHLSNRLISWEQLYEIASDPRGLLNQWLWLGVESLETEGNYSFNQLDDVRQVEYWLEAWRQDRKTRKQRIPPWLKDAKAEAILRDLGATIGLCDIAARTWEKLVAGMLRDQSFSFSMLESLTIGLLRSDTGAAERIRRTYRALLVDESQDLNPVQYAIIDSLQQPHVMMVGDPQQSIYQFRHADRKLFISRSQEWPTFSLAKNFRSSEGILNFVDEVFSSKWLADYQRMSKGAQEEGFGGNLPSQSFAGVEIWEVPENQVRYRVIAKRIAQLIEQGEEPGRIALLGRTAKDLSGFSDALSEIGIGSQLLGETEKYYARMEIRDVANALTAIADPTRTHSWQALLLSPFVNLSLDAVVLLSALPSIPDALESFESPVDSDAPKLERLLNWLPEAREMADRWAAWELLSSLLARTPLLENLARRPGGREMIANVRKLLSIAAKAPHLGPLEFAEEVRTTRLLKHKASDASVADANSGLVTLLTLHKSKGLEFPVVVVDHLKPNKLRASNLRCHPDAPVMAWSDEPKAGLAHGLLSELAKQKEMEELDRLLYVGLTRAKERLCLAAGNQHYLGTILNQLTGPRSIHRDFVRIKEDEATGVAETTA